MFKFKAKTATDDGRLTAGRVYEGGFVVLDKPTLEAHITRQFNPLRIVVYDNKNEWMTFDPNVFEPVKPQKIVSRY